MILMKDHERERWPRVSDLRKGGGRGRGWTRILFGRFGEILGQARQDARDARKEARKARKPVKTATEIQNEAGEARETALEPQEKEQMPRRARRSDLRRWYAYALVMVAIGLLAATLQQSYHLFGSVNKSQVGQNTSPTVKREEALPAAQKGADSSQEAVGRLKQGVRTELGDQLQAGSNQGVGPQATPAGNPATSPPAAAPAIATPASTTPAVKPAISAPATVSQPAERFGNLVWPARGEAIVSFGWRKHPVFGDWRFHDGLDLNVPAGTPVVAVFPGTVVEASRMPVPYHSKADAYTVVIEHGGGWRSTYGLLAQILVAKGDQVSRGKVIGRAGMIPGGEGAGEALLHFALARDGASVDPRAWLP